MPIWNEKFETMKRNELEQEQLERLQQTLSRVYRRVSHYQNLFNEIDFDPDSISSLTDLKKIPYTTKDTLRLAYPYDMFAVPLREVVRMQSTSGTTGQPLIVGYSRNDIEYWTELTARVLYAGGVTKDDIINICFPYGLFTVIPSSEADIENQLTVMKDYKTTAITCAPTYAAQLCDIMNEKGITPAELSLSKGLFGAEAWSETFRNEIQDKLSISITDNYGLTEIIGPGVSFECDQKNGLHISEDHFIPEIIDPDTGEILGPGEKGELVLTTITKEAYPLVRYRTGDLTTLRYEDCGCGRSLVKMDKVFERVDDMIILNGQNIFPSQFEQILTEVIGTTPKYQLIIDKIDNLDELEVQIEVSGDFFFDEIKKLEQIESAVTKELKKRFDFIPKVTLVEPRTIKRKMKQIKVIDRRHD